MPACAATLARASRVACTSASATAPGIPGTGPGTAAGPVTPAPLPRRASPAAAWSRPLEVHGQPAIP